jgi:hypothetical protein
MASIISAGTTSGTALNMAGDTSGVLQLATNGSTTAITIDTSQRAAFVAGTAALPAITTTGDTNTGMFFPAADTIAFAEGGAEAMRLDSSGFVGIGTSSPASQLHIYSTAAQNQFTEGLRVNRDSQTGQYGIFNYYGGTCTITAVDSLFSAPAICFQTSTNGTTTTERMRIDSSGNLLIGRTNNPSGFTSGLYVTGAYSTTTPSGANVFINTDGSFFRSTSSIKYKTNVENYAKGLDDLSKLRPVTYQAKEGINTEQVFAGFVAEEVHEVGLTEFVQYAEDGTPDALSYGNMVALCVRAIQEQQTIINDLKARITALEGAA